MAYLRHRAGLAMSMYPARTSTPRRYGMSSSATPRWYSLRQSVRETPSFWASAQLARLESVTAGMPRRSDEVEEAVALRRLAALAVAEDGADVERDVVLLRAGDDVREQVAGRLVAAGGEPADPHRPFPRGTTASSSPRSSARRSRQAAASG